MKALSTPQHPAVRLVTDRRAEAVVYVAPSVGPHQRSRAFEVLLKELIEVIELSTGAKLPVVEEMPGPERPTIVIGDCAASQEAGVDAAALLYEEFVVKTAPNRVFLVGSTRELQYAKEMAQHQVRWPGPIANEGDAWAVADFLERFVGVRWYWPTEALGRSIVKADSLTVPPVHYGDAPVFRFRDFGLWGALRTIPSSPSKDFRVGRWFDKHSPLLPVPEGVESLTPPYAQLREGISWPFQISVHTLPVSEELPLCSQELIDYMLKGAADYWERNERWAWWVTPESIHVSYPDHGVNISHVKEEFRKFVKGGTWDRSSHVMGLTVKMLAEEVKRRWPDKKVVYLPYWDYVTAPDLEFPDNLEIQLCLTHTDGMAGMAEPGKRARNDANIRNWSEKAGGRIGLWDYAGVGHTCTFAPTQHPHLIQAFYQQHRDRLAGSFMDTSSVALWSKGAPTMYVWMRLLWNPDVDVDAILDEWCRRMFGPAAGTTRELLQLMCDRWEKSAWSRPKGESVGLGYGGVVFSDKWPPAVVETMDELRLQALAELQGDAQARQRFQYWLGEDMWAAFRGEAELTWEAAGLIPKKPRITAFGFSESANFDPPVHGNVIENIGGGEAEGNPLYPFGREINVAVPVGTDLAALCPTIAHSGASVRPESGTPRDFTQPVTYTVTGQDGAAAVYTVHVRYKTEKIKVGAISTGTLWANTSADKRLGPGSPWGGDRAYSYIKFVVPETSGRIKNATLSIFYKGYGSNPPLAHDIGYVAADDWNVAGFELMPEPEATVSVATGESGSWREAEITAWLSKKARGQGKPLVVRLHAPGNGVRDPAYGEVDENTAPFLTVEIDYDTVEALRADRKRFKDAMIGP
ncbi:MAG: DUF4838 domain-containing protein [Planctomycetales bacterium]